MTRPTPAAPPPPALNWTGLAAEPFRLFFPAAVLAGALGTLIWPIYFAGWTESYPGTSHARLMAHGFFGGFILGFLGTAWPRMLSAPRFTTGQVTAWLLLHLAVVTAHAMGRTRTGDLLFLVLLAAFAGPATVRFFKRQDLPPPGLVMLPMAWICGLAGGLLALGRDRFEEAHWGPILEPLLYYQGFVLLPLLGLAGFMLPRFFGLPNRQDLPESRRPTRTWSTGAALASLVGLAVVASLVIEARGYARLGHGLRLLVAAGWLLREVPLHRRGLSHNAFSRCLQLAVLFLLGGFLVELFFPEYRVANLHLTLMGGLAILTLAVATRVVFGHTGHRAGLGGRNRWFAIVVSLALLAMATRISGDLWPAIMKSHYIYGALIWILALGIWCWRVLSRIRISDPEP